MAQIARAYRIQLRDDSHPTGAQGGIILTGPMLEYLKLCVLLDAYAAGKLIFLVNTETMEVVDVDSALTEGHEYKVHVEPEVRRLVLFFCSLSCADTCCVWHRQDSTPFNIMPCFLSLCTQRGFTRGNYLGE